MSAYTYWDRGFIDFDVVCSSVCPILLGQEKIGQRWHGKWANWWNSQMEVNEIYSSVKPPCSCSQCKLRVHATKPLAIVA